MTGECFDLAEGGHDDGSLTRFGGWAKGGHIGGDREMTDIWTFQSTDWDDEQDLAGYDVEATDGHIGKVDESTAATDREHIVVDTGFWIFGKKRMIPAGTIKQINHEGQKVFVTLTKEQVKDAPDFDETRRLETDYRSNHEQYYGPFQQPL